MPKRSRWRAVVRWICLAIVAAALAVGTVGISKTFQECTRDAGHPGGAQAAGYDVAKLLVVAGTYRDCAGEFLQQNGAAVTAAFIVILALSTIALWWSTRRLWLANEEQLALSREAASRHEGEVATSVKIAEEAAAVARQSTDMVRQSLASLERAYVFADSHNMRQATGDDPLRPFHFTAVWKNTGRTRTVRARNHISWSALKTPLPPDFQFPDLGAHPTAPLLIAPGAAIMGQRVDIPHQVIAEAMEGKNQLYAWGWCEYNDVFPGTQRHRTEFCVKLERVEVADAPGVPAGQRRISVQFVHHHQYNGADEDCLKRVQT
jgi:hypothetical protein